MKREHSPRKVFELRREIKFVVADTQAYLLQGWLLQNRMNMHIQHPSRVVRNIYFDKCSMSSFMDNIDGVGERNKLRYRWYGDGDYPSEGTLEVKARRNSLGYKHTERLPSQAAYTSHRALRKHLSNVSSFEIAEALSEFTNAVLLNTYSREYFVSSCGRVRATLDTDLKYFDQKYSDTINVSRSYERQRYAVLELKFDPELTDYVSRHSTNLPVVVSKHSKFVNGIHAGML